MRGQHGEVAQRTGDVIGNCAFTDWHPRLLTPALHYLRALSTTIAYDPTIQLLHHICRCVCIHSIGHDDRKLRTNKHSCSTCTSIDSQDPVGRWHKLLETTLRLMGVVDWTVSNVLASR
jgi:hypothetical protein